MKKIYFDSYLKVLHLNTCKAVQKALLLPLLLLCFLLIPGLPARAAGVTVMLDPGHGGPNATSDNLGAQYAPYSEKALTLELAQKIAAELAQYDGITVGLTRTGDTSLTLAQRAASAKASQADMLVSLHFNATGSHLYYGSEVWTSAFGSNYAAGASFGQTVLFNLQTLGLYSKGVKTRIGSHGDYYGIIRESVSQGIPAVIIEHCYMDNQTDRTLGVSNLSALAHADATAIAQYFHLKAKSGSPDYTGFVRPAASAAPAAGISQDVTPPETCRLEVLSNDGAGHITCRLTAKDTDTIYPVLYYSFSVNGISTALLPYSQAAGSIIFTATVPVGQTSTITATAYNSYELSTLSNAVSVN